MLNVIEEMSQARERLKHGQWVDTPVWPAEDLLQFVAKQLMNELRKSSAVPNPETTRALAAYQTWEANRR
jgi:hypothetical protein